jgi:hypothetical protein
VQRAHGGTALLLRSHPPPVKYILPQIGQLRGRHSSQQHRAEAMTSLACYSTCAAPAKNQTHRQHSRQQPELRQWQPWQQHNWLPWRCTESSRGRALCGETIHCCQRQGRVRSSRGIMLPRQHDCGTQGVPGSPGCTLGGRGSTLPEPRLPLLPRCTAHAGVGTGTEHSDHIGSRYDTLGSHSTAYSARQVAPLAVCAEGAAPKVMLPCKGLLEGNLSMVYPCEPH